MDSAAYYYALARANFAQEQDSVGMADMYNSEAVLFYARGLYTLAFDKAVMAESIFERSPDLAGDLNQNRLVIASIYAAMDDTLNAIVYHRQSTAYFKEQSMLRQYLSNAALLCDLLMPRYQEFPELSDLIQEMVENSTMLQCEPPGPSAI